MRKSQQMFRMLAARRVSVPTVIAVSLLTACVDEQNPVTTAPQFSVEDRETLEVASGERHLLALAREDPTFAGVFEEDGTIVVLGTDAARLPELSDLHNRRAGEARAAQGRLPEQKPREGRVASYSFLDLATWRNQIFDMIWSHPAVVGIDLDERQNKVLIELTADGMAEVARQLLTLDVPEGAYAIRVGRADQPSTKQVTSRHRPVPGGLKIVYDYGLYQYGCTLGFNAILNGDLVFFTNSHCSPGQYQLTTSHTQGQALGSAVIGDEDYDPPGFDCSSWWPWTHTSSNCREADAAAYGYSIPDDSVALGFLARHNDRHQGPLPPLPPPRTFDETDPLEIVDLASNWDIRTGVTVEKLGRTTGWTYGTVNETCSRKKVNVQHGSGHYTVLCAYRTDYESGPGDSGGPVFILHSNGDHVTLAGIHYGNSSSSSSFSSVSAIEEDIGEFAAFIDGGPSVSVSGPSLIPPGVYCTWTATGSGGATPYSYTWSGVASGSGASLSKVVNTSGFLTVTITDGNSATSNYSHYVTVSGSASTPPQCDE